MALHSDLKTFDCNTADLMLAVWHGVYCVQFSVLFLGASCSEVNTAGQFTHNDHIKAVSNDLFL